AEDDPVPTARGSDTRCAHQFFNSSVRRISSVREPNDRSIHTHVTRRTPMQKLTYVICSFMLLIVVGLSAAIAQTGSSNITGSVRDVNGAVVPGATVTAKNDATGVTSTQTTTDSGL